MSCISYRTERDNMHPGMNKYIATDARDDAHEGIQRCKQQLAILIAMSPKVLVEEREDGDQTVEYIISDRVEDLVESIVDYTRDMMFYDGLLVAMEHKEDELRIEDD